MSQIHPVQALLDEHRVIEGVLNVLEAKALRLGAGPFPADWFAEALEFFRHFVEGCHHNKEEELVFPELRARGLLEQHTTGTAHVDKLEATLAAAGRGFPGGGALSPRSARVRAIPARTHRSGRRNPSLGGAATRDRKGSRATPKTHQPGEFHRMDDETYDAYLALAEKLTRAQAA